MPISPWAKGQTSPAWVIPLTRDGGAIMDITGVTSNQLILNIYSSNGSLIGTGGGSFTIINSSPGIVRYQPVAADSATIGQNSVRIIVNFNGNNPDYSDLIQWVVAA
jgi:hypothetical protein